MVELEGYCLSNCPKGYYVSKNESCVPCWANPEICDQLFVGEMRVLRSEEMMLVVYFSQKTELLRSIEDVNITFADENNNLVALSLKDYQFTPYLLKFSFHFEAVSYLTARLTIPYLHSQDTDQAISLTSYSQLVYYFNNYQNDD